MWQVDKSWVSPIMLTGQMGEVSGVQWAPNSTSKVKCFPLVGGRGEGV